MRERVEREIAKTEKEREEESEIRERWTRTES